MYTAGSHTSSRIAAAPLSAWIRQAGLHLKTWLQARAAAAGEAALYQELSRLSDAELHRLGLSRATLASDIAQ